ncbi:flagellar filament capping protein FliD [Corticimicrobacter populi]|uniref:Flagellar hook-associated protein 2 n=1 Tax=Corticimicrobacter populi TaxID=2175229 RepID=A0A2V1JYS6_9BURK|nr:flagellar filament capping protein FliD [Corticimicrobacter populi]PWF21215.1 hypothetical protein DD235_15465 [Corticimicrobacter populi]
MATSSIGSNLGAGSGLPLQEMIAKLRTVEEQPLILMRNQNSRYTSQLNAYESLKKSVTALQTAGKTLQRDPDSILDRDKHVNVFGTTSSTVIGGEGYMTATTGNGAIAGQYQITIQQLATRGVHSAQLDGVDRYEQMGTGGTITFQLKGDAADAKPRTLDLSKLKGTSLEEIVKGINDDKTLGVRATIINDGTTNHLQLSSADTGTEAEIVNVAVAGNTEVATLFGNLQQSDAQKAKDALFTVNGIAITSGSNSVKDAIQGITLDLTATTALDPNDPNSAHRQLQLQVEDDLTPASDAIKAFVNAYNAVLTQIDTYTRYNADSEDRTTDGVLSGDYTVRSIQGKLRETLSPTLSEGEIRTLSKLGITTNYKTGKLEIDETKLNEGLKDHAGDVSALFQGENGVVAKTNKITEDMLRNDENGLFFNRTEGIKESQKNLEKQFEAAQQRIEQTMATYEARFVALDTLVAQMQSTSSYLTQQITVLNGTRNS